MTRTSHPRKMIRSLAASKSRGPKVRGLMAVVFLINVCTPAIAQNMLNADPVSAVNLLPGDAAVLEMEEVKKDLPCTVTSVKPALGFDLHFHSGYEISLPLKELAGNGQTLTVLFSVTSNTAKDNPRYFSQKFTVPELPDDAGGKTLLEGGFDVGEGSYHVRWLMRDHMERVCSSNWDISAALNGKDQDMKMSITANDVEASNPEFFSPEPPVARKTDGEPLKVKILINYAPQERQDFAAAAMPAVDASALISILRTIAREPRIMKFSIVAFNLNDQRVVYRASDLDEINFPDLGRQLRSVKLGMVDYKHLADPHSPTDFLTHLVQDELSGNPANAVIFAGPKAFIDEPVTPDSLKDIGTISYPVFYMNYMLASPADTTPWRDAIGSVVKRLRGYEYTITRPRDLWTSWTDIMNHISKMKLASTANASSH
jgi:hypothetical protein